MPPRFIVRRAQADHRYSVWDNEKNRVAVEDLRECRDLSFEDAFKALDRLNDEDPPKKE